MKKIKSLFVFISMFFINIAGRSQTDRNKADMADTMRSNGRIYVVVAVVLVILIGLIMYIARLDKKITKMEKENR
jgi:K+-transporting ATPase A subunit